jgi:serine/threonine-protein kinase
MFLHDRLPEDSRPELESHLAACPGCRDKLDELAGGQPWWAEVRKHLGGDGASAIWPTLGQDETHKSATTALDFLQPSDQPGSLGRLGIYEILEVLGWGGMGVVLRAFDPSLHRPVAIKVLAAELAANGAARKRFAREAQAAAAVAHDHVVPVHAVDSQASPPYLVMGFIPGQSLQQRLERSGPLEIKEILRIGVQTASGLAAAHAQGLVHRDIKPANIMLENGIERVRITDFGLARAVDDASVTQNGAVAGTPQYMAPEQARGEAIDQRADLFALGSTLYAMATGRPPFRGESTLSVIRQVCDAQPVSMRSINADVPAWLEGIVDKLHAKDPAGRFQSAAEIAALLERCLAHVQQPDRQPLPPQAVDLGRRVARREHPRWRWPVFGGVSVFLALLVGAALALLAWPGGASRQPGLTGASPLETAVATRLDEELQDGWEQARSSLDRLQQSLASEDVIAGDGMNDELQSARRRAEQLQRELTAPSEADADSVSAELQNMRRRLDALKRSAERWPE